MIFHYIILYYIRIYDIISKRVDNSIATKEAKRKPNEEINTNEISFEIRKTTSAVTAEIQRGNIYPGKIYFRASKAPPLGVENQLNPLTSTSTFRREKSNDTRTLTTPLGGENQMDLLGSYFNFRRWKSNGAWNTSSPCGGGIKLRHWARTSTLGGESK